MVGASCASGPADFIGIHINDGGIIRAEFESGGRGTVRKRKCFRKVNPLEHPLATHSYCDSRWRRTGDFRLHYAMRSAQFSCQCIYLGRTQGASFGAAFAIVCLGGGAQANVATADAVVITNPYLVTGFAFLGGIFTTAIILGLSRIARVSPSTMVLAGVALSSMFSAGTTIIQYFANDVQVAAVVYWTFGDLGRTNWQEIGAMFILSVLACLYFLFHRWDYNAMDHGAQTAKSLGIHVDALMLSSMAICSLVVSICVAFVGCISFIGLIAPHIVRKFLGTDHRFLIPASALAGAIILVLAELVSRTVVSPAILPVGAITSFLGAPLFLVMIFQKRRRGLVD